MNKSKHFTGQPTISQLVKLLPKSLVKNCVEETKADHYYKKFNTWHHLVSMLFACFGHCHSLREVVTGMKALEGRLLSCGIKYFPARSTFSEANANRDSLVFEKIYFRLKQYWDAVYPDSRNQKGGIYIIDSTTIRLFQEIFRGVGPIPCNGKKKGGLKVHMAVEESQCVPSIIHLTQAASKTSHLQNTLIYLEEAQLLWIVAIKTIINITFGLSNKSGGSQGLRLILFTG